MKKLLYLEINQVPYPKEVRNDVKVDCKQVATFCSYIGDALVGDLRDYNNGKPYYQLLSPVGQLIGDYECQDIKSYAMIVMQWFNLLENIIIYGAEKLERYADISFPKQYVDWLLQNENKYYNVIGSYLLSNGNKVILDIKEIASVIFAQIFTDLKRITCENSDEFDFLINSDNITGSSYYVKQIEKQFPNLHFVNLNKWKHNIDNINDYRFFIWMVFH